MNQTIAIAGMLAIAGTVATCWNQVKAFFSKVSNYLIVHSTLEGSDMYWAVNNYLYKNFRKSPLSERNYQGRDVFVRPMDRVQVVAFEEIGKDTIFFWRGWRPLWVTFSKDAGDAPDQARTMKVSFIRGFFDLESVLIDALEQYNSSRGDISEPTRCNRFEINFVFGRRKQEHDDAPSSSGGKLSIGIDKLTSGKPLKWGPDEIGPRLPVKNSRPTDLLVLSTSASDAVNEARFWRESEPWYKERGIPWRRGWLLYGRPGTGKTSMARAVAQELDLPVYVFDVASLSNEELREGWRRMLRSAPCMAVIEDIDGTFHGRKNVACEGKQDPGLTFDALLNALDGIERSDGVLVVITTNDITKVDPAIGIPSGDGSRSSRPGRIDRVIEMTLPSREGLLLVAKRIMTDQPENWEPMTDEAAARQDTIAQFQELCGQVALAHRYKTRTESALVRRNADEASFAGRDSIIHIHPPAPEGYNKVFMVDGSVKYMKANSTATRTGPAIHKLANVRPDK